MRRKELADVWALSQIEAAADGSLGREQAERMVEAMDEDPALRAAVGRARQVRGALSSIEPAPVPKRLLFKLLALPAHGVSARGAPRRAKYARWSFASAALAIAAVTAVLVSRTPEPEEDPRLIAAQEEFALAMAYVHRSAVIANDEIAEHVRHGLREALDASRSSLLEREPDTENGD